MVESLLFIGARAGDGVGSGPVRIIIDADPQHWLPEPPFLAGAIAGALFCPAPAPTPSTTVNIYFYGTLGYFIFDSVFQIRNLSLNCT